MSARRRDLEALTVPQLRARAAEFGLSVGTKVRKAALVSVIAEAERGQRTSIEGQDDLTTSWSAQLLRAAAGPSREPNPAAEREQATQAAAEAAIVHHFACTRSPDHGLRRALRPGAVAFSCRECGATITLGPDLRPVKPDTAGHEDAEPTPEPTPPEAILPIVDELAPRTAGSASAHPTPGPRVPRRKPGRRPDRDEEKRDAYWANARRLRAETGDWPTDEQMAEAQGVEVKTAWRRHKRYGWPTG